VYCCEEPKEEYGKFYIWDMFIINIGDRRLMSNKKEMEEIKDKTKIKVEDLLKSYPDGLTITEMMQKTGLARHTLLSRLHNLEGQDKIGVRQINMAKLHRWKHENEPIKEKKPEDVEVKEIKEEHVKKAPSKEEVLEEKTKEKELDKKVVSDKKEEVKEGATSEDDEVVKPSKIDIAQIKKDVEAELHSGVISKPQAQLKHQREPLKQAAERIDVKKKIDSKKYVVTGVPGFDELLYDGIPRGNSILVAGGAGSGKTIFCLQSLAYQAKAGKKCLVMSFEESEDRLIQHMEDFGWNPHDLIKKGTLKIQRFNPFDITRNVDALLAKQKGELLIDIDPIIIPKDFKPDFIVLDSLTAIASAFTGKEESYRIYIEQLFRFFEKINATSYLVTETEQVPRIFSKTGVEEFLADGVIVLYSLKHGNVRENAIEMLKLRGAAHQKKIVAMQVTGEGVVVYPEQEVFSEIANDLQK
jgi:KaiC/GvpD/RAD55 family RecA-like ATPase